MTVLRTCFSCAALALVLACAAPPGARAADCTLKQAASFDLTPTPSGNFTIPVEIAGKTYRFDVELGVAYSAISEKLSQDLQMERKRLPAVLSRGIGVNGHVTHYWAILPAFEFGGLKGQNLALLAVPDWDRAGADGIIGLDLLANFDNELDLKAGKLNLFSPDHCPGEVVYWATASYAAVPFQIDPTGLPYFDALLDGKVVTASFSMGSGTAEMGMSNAQDALGLEPDDPKLVPMVNPPADLKTAFRYPFKTLSIGGITIRNPNIAIYPQTDSEKCSPKLRFTPPRSMRSGPTQVERCFGATQLVLGQAELRALHLYFSFKEKKIYVTASGAAAPTAAGAAGSTSQ